jgi:hypothetical protein
MLGSNDEGEEVDTCNQFNQRLTNVALHNYLTLQPVVPNNLHPLLFMTYHKLHDEQSVDKVMHTVLGSVYRQCHHRRQEVEISAKVCITGRVSGPQTSNRALIFMNRSSLGVFTVNIYDAQAAACVPWRVKGFLWQCVPGLQM